MTESASPQANAASDPIAEVRTEIDAVDRAMLDLVARRLSLADKLTRLKPPGSSPIRPGREVSLLRRLIASAPPPVEPELVVELWRALIAANVRRQAPVDVFVGGGNDPVRLYDIARRHFGARTRIIRAQDPQAALTRAAEKPNAVAVAPWPAAPSVGSWWPALSESRFHKLHLIGGLPVRGPIADEPEACVFSAAPNEAAGDDISMLIVFDPHHKAMRALNEVGFKGREVARSEPRALIRVEGFIAHDDPRASAMNAHGLDGVRVLGSYARV